MNETIKRTRLILAVMFLALFVGACGTTSTPAGGSSTPPTGGSTTPAASATPTPTPSVTPTPTSGVSPLAGTWNGNYMSTVDSSYGTFTMTWTVNGSHISGPIDIKNSACIGKGTITGTLNGNHISFGAVKGAQTVTYSGTVGGNSMSGTYSAPDCGHGKGTWTATKAA